MNLPDTLASRLRPRERLLRSGPGALHDTELLALVLRTGQRGCNALELARRLLQHHDGLHGVFAAQAQELCSQPGLGLAKACALLAIPELSRRTIEETLTGRSTLQHADEVRRYCRTALSHQPVEHCIALFLDQQLRLLACVTLSQGTLARASVFPREVVREALRLHAAALILAHNHPSGNAQPSAADCAFTRQLGQALALVDIRLVDHLIIAREQAFSMAEAGLL
ncbi:RadC family protein [Bordetella trematum]|uniref:RadC family protein n=1 Tax=Bordetella trematum TaxID=123899 RepID=UPI000D989731|nr:DNA repair protein RadC [Bordetella trematum]SPU53820.1 DNA repair protein RadC [Bordetella trematum]VDH06308.1 DNA repair protein RadC [Bordetella trematum]